MKGISSYTIKLNDSVGDTRRSLTKDFRQNQKLLMQRLKELDREFARQTKQLTAMTKKLGARVKVK